jgi:putative flippase GtrA
LIKGEHPLGTIKKLLSEKKALFLEMFRYLIVGGLAFIVDFGVLVLCREFIFTEAVPFGLYISTAAGFIAGLLFNYVFSILFVFESAKKSRAGRSVKDFIVFTLIGVIGLLLTEVGMYVGADLLGQDYRLVKIVVTAIVLLWNYLGRKLLIFKE